MTLLHTILICITICNYAYGQDEIIGFYFPTAETGNRSPDGKTPIANLEICGENELYYPGNTMDDGICDCKPSYVFNPEDEKCYPLFQQGFCTKGRHVVLSKDGFTPKCKLNVCHLDKKVIYKDKCVTLGDPCDVDDRRVYGVDDTTLEITCLEPFVFSRMKDQQGNSEPNLNEDKPKKKCSKGSKMRYKKMCTP